MTGRMKFSSGRTDRFQIVFRSLAAVHNAVTLIDPTISNAETTILTLQCAFTKINA